MPARCRATSRKQVEEEREVLAPVAEHDRTLKARPGHEDVAGCSGVRVNGGHRSDNRECRDQKRNRQPTGRHLKRLRPASNRRSVGWLREVGLLQVCESRAPKARRLLIKPTAGVRPVAADPLTQRRLRQGVIARV
jgi:hypothetical protein